MLWISSEVYLIWTLKILKKNIIKILTLADKTSHFYKLSKKSTSNSYRFLLPKLIKNEP